MELRHLRYFVAVAEEGSFTRAARRLYVAQPALSRQIRDLEAEVGIPLLDRHARGVRTTSAGEAFLAGARCTLERAALAVDSARHAADLSGSVLRFAHGELYAYSAHVERLLAAWGAAHPDVPVRVSSQSDERTHDALLEGTADVGCVFVPRWPIERFGGAPLADASATGVLLPARHPLAAKREVRLAELASLHWMGITRSRWPGFREQIEAELAQRGLQTLGEPELASASPMVRIAAGEAWALANEEMAAAYQRESAVTYRPLSDPPIPIRVVLVWGSPGPWAGWMTELLPGSA